MAMRPVTVAHEQHAPEFVADFTSHGAMPLTGRDKGGAFGVTIDPSAVQVFGLGRCAAIALEWVGPFRSGKGRRHARGWSRIADVDAVGEVIPDTRKTPLQGNGGRSRKPLFCPGEGPAGGSTRFTNRSSVGRRVRTCHWPGYPFSAAARRIRQCRVVHGVPHGAGAGFASRRQEN